MEGFNGVQHPLQTRLILERIFEHLDDYADLKDCRLVCKAWRDASRKAMRASTEVAISCDESSPWGISKFLELVESEESTFFQGEDKPLAEHFILRGGEGDSREFWKAAGTHIKSLGMVEVEFQSADSFRHAIFQSCPNLEKLEICLVKVHGERVQEPKEWVMWVPPIHSPNGNLRSLVICGVIREFNITWLEILGIFPNLEKLNAHGVGGSGEEAFFNALEIARQHDATCWNLKEVDICGQCGGSKTIPVPPSFIRIFGGGDLTLSNLGISWCDGNTREEMTTVQNILATHAPTLKELALSHVTDEYPEMDIFPLPLNQIFEKVQVLKLIGIKWRSSRFLQAFPNVKKLTLDVDEIPEDLQAPNVTLNHCTQLTLFNRIRTNEEFQRLLKLLPNVKILTISDMDNEWFSMICQAWPNLTHLKLFRGMGLDDMGLTGYDEDEVKKINKEGREGSWRPITVRRASLSSLKNLQSFWWKLSSEEYSKLGYCSVACGVLELPELKYLCVAVEIKDHDVNQIQNENPEEDQEDEQDGNQDQEEEEKEYVPLFDSLPDKFTWNKTQKKKFK